MSPTGPPWRCENADQRFFEAAEAGIKRALKCGAQAPLLMVLPDPQMGKSLIASIYGALKAVDTALRRHECESSKAFKVGRFFKMQMSTF